MKISIKGASINNLKDINVDFENGLTAVTGISGSGKTSLVFDTLYAESRRRFLSVFSGNFLTENLAHANIKSISGLSPVTVLKQNKINRNPNSILATASGLHSFLRLLYTHFGTQSCNECGSDIAIFSKEEIIDDIALICSGISVDIFIPFVNGLQGSHTTLLQKLDEEYGQKKIFVDGNVHKGKKLDQTKKHNIYVYITTLSKTSHVSGIKKTVNEILSSGTSSVVIKYGNVKKSYSLNPVCQKCGNVLEKPLPKYFHTPCPFCNRKGCPKCNGTGLHPVAANVKWNGLTMTDLLKYSVDDTLSFFSNTQIPSYGTRLKKEITGRLDILSGVGLGYISLDRPSPTLSRGESQHMRLAVALTSRFEDIVHILDEPTIGLHPSDVLKLMPKLKNLGGPVIFIEHDNLAVLHADHAVDMGPDAGINGGNILYSGTPYELWKEDSKSGRYFSNKEMPFIPTPQEKPDKFISIKGAIHHNLKNINVKIPLSRLTVVTGVSGSGKSTLIEDVLVNSLLATKPSGCSSITSHALKPVYVDQNPIGMNSRSNTATYTGLAAIIRDVFSSLSGINKSVFSFNTKEGSCSECGGTGEVEVHMRFMPSVMIKCFACDGKRFSDNALKVKIKYENKEITITDILDMSVDEAIHFFEMRGGINTTKINSALSILNSLHDTGLGYIKLGQPSPSLSGGEAQRMKLAGYLTMKNPDNYLLVLDEPTTGLHPANVADLIRILSRLTGSGTTIVIVEHNIDLIRSADWIIDLGPGSGPEGGNLVYQGDTGVFFKSGDISVTASAMNTALKMKPKENTVKKHDNENSLISIKNAYANNLKNIDVKIPKSKLTVITGISGSGKSSLVHDVIENEAKHTFFESLNVYERFNMREKEESRVGSIKGLGITMTLGNQKKVRDVRSTVGTASEISYHLGVLYSLAGKRKCPSCDTYMKRHNNWVCPSCGYIMMIGTPHHFLGYSYDSACHKCHGVGTVSVPNPSKLIVNPDKPLCSGAMYSPGFFPQGYLGKPYNGGYYLVMALAKKFGFDPFVTPWNEMGDEARDVFLFGDTDLHVESKSKAGITRTYDCEYKGFYGTWLGNWDIFGTYTDNIDCPECSGSKLRKEFLEVSLGKKNIHQLNIMPLDRLQPFIESINKELPDNKTVTSSYDVLRKRIGFLIKSGLGYVSTGRQTLTLSAGEAQRVRLASLLGSGLVSLTLLLDEPTRGLHGNEIATVIECIKELTHNGNTVIVVEHDPYVIINADHVIDMGPGSGKDGGRIVYQGPPENLSLSGTLTGNIFESRIFKPKKDPLPVDTKWLTLKGASENNLKIKELNIPYGTITGVCGVSGSGKSTLIVDTIGRILSPVKHTTSVSNEPLKPGKYESIENIPANTVIIDQVIKNITNPSDYLGLTPLIEKYFSSSEERELSGIDPELFKRCCRECKGRGWIKMDMSFLPDTYEKCDLCNGTGYPEDIHEIRIRNYSLPDMFSLTLDEVSDFFKDHELISKKIAGAINTGLGYLVLRQSSVNLSGGEIQRLKIAGELSGNNKEQTIYILDEPTVGLHLENVRRLISVFEELVKKGNTVIVIEHNIDLLITCDHIIELGPGGGEDGGRIIYEGIPAGLVDMNTPTSVILKEMSGYKP